MEAGHGEAGFALGDVEGLSVETAPIDGLDDGDDCTDSVSQNFRSGTDQLTLYPGDDAGMEIDGQYLITCNITSFEVPDDCGDQSESSWVMFR